MRAKQQGKVTVLEGVCCAGKTTLLKGLASELKAGIVPELPEFGRNLFMPFSNPENIAGNALRSVPIEKVRAVAAIGLSEVADNVIMDRSYFSTLALSYGAIDITGESAYRRLSNSILEMMKNEEMPLPNHLLYLRIDADTVASRNQTRVPPLEDYWIDTNRITRQNDFYRELADLEGIAVIDGEVDRQAALTDCLEAIRYSGTLVLEEVLGGIEQFRDNVA